MTPVIRVDEEVMAALKSQAIELGLVFKPPNLTLRRVLGLDADLPGGKVTEEAGLLLQSPSATPMTSGSQWQRFGRLRTAISVKDTVTGQVYPSKYKAGLAFCHEFPNGGRRYLWYLLIRKYQGRFVEIDTGKAW